MSSPHIPTPRDSEEKASRIFVAIAWAGSSIAALAFVAAYGRNVPFMEDVELVDVYSGHRPASFAWLWEQMTEHRFVLPKALLLAFWRASGDFRTGMFFDVVAVASIALAFAILARHLRGRASYADAFFPVALLGLGNYENLLFSSQVYYVLPMVLFATVVVVIATDRARTTRGATAVATAIALLPLCGGIGLLLAPCLIIWSVGMAWRDRVAEKAVATRLLGGSITSALLGAIYFVGFQYLTQAGTVPRSVTSIARTALQAFGSALGRASQTIDPLPGLAVLAACLGAGWLLAKQSGRTSDRRRALALLACLSSGSLVLVGIGLGRAQVAPDAGSPSHYGWLALMPLSCAYLALALSGGGIVPRVAQLSLMAASLVVYGADVRAGMDYARSLSAVDDALLTDVRDGLPPEALAQRYCPRLYPTPERMAERLDMLRSDATGPYKGVSARVLAPSAPFAEVPIPLTTIAANQAFADGSVIHGTGSDPYVIYALPEARYVCGIRLEYEVANTDARPAETQVRWRLSGRNDFEEAERTITVPTGEGLRTETIWVFDTIDSFRIDPDSRPCEMRLRAVTLLVKEGATPIPEPRASARG